MLAKNLIKKIIAIPLLATFIFASLPFTAPQNNIAYADNHDTAIGGIVETVETVGAGAAAAGGAVGTAAGAVGDFIADDGLLEETSFNYGSCTTNIFCWIMLGFKTGTIFFLNFVAKIWAILLMIGANLTYSMMAYGMDVINLPIVKAGFEVSLLFTNLFFVIAVIVMAFGTMLRSKSYNIKSQLKRLIFAAILVNFSFLIAGLFIDLSNVLTAQFLEGAKPEHIGKALQPQSLLGLREPKDFGIVASTTPDGTTPGGKVIPGSSGIHPEKVDGKFLFHINNDDSGWAVWFKLAQSLFIATLMTVLMAIIMIAIGIMILVRNVWLAILLIFMPLVWAIGLIPRLSEYQKKWWDNFIQWIIYLPTVTFFVFLAISTMLVTSRSGGLLGGEFFENIIQILVLLGLLYGAIKVGKVGGALGAGLAFAVGGFVGSKLTRMATGAGGNLLRRGGQAADWGSKGLRQASQGRGALGIPGQGLGYIGQGIGKTLKGVGRTATFASNTKIDKKGGGAVLNKVATFAQDTVSGEKSIPVTPKRWRAMQEERARQRAGSAEWKDKSKEEIQAKLDSGNLSKLDTAAALIALASKKGLEDFGANSKAAIDSMEKASGFMGKELKDSITKSISSKNVLLGATLASLDQAKSKRDKKKLEIERDINRGIDSLINALGGKDQALLDSLDNFMPKQKGDSFARLKPSKINNEPVRQRVIRFAINAGVAGALDNADAQKEWRGVIAKYASTMPEVETLKAQDLVQMPQSKAKAEIQKVQRQVSADLAKKPDDDALNKKLDDVVHIQKIVDQYHAVFQTPGVGKK